MADCVVNMREIARPITSEIALYDMSVDQFWPQSGVSHEDQCQCQCQCRYRECEEEEEEELEEVRSTRQRVILVEI